MPEIMVTGENAVKFLAEKYRWNLYVSDYSVMKLIAYRQRKDVDGQLDTDYKDERVFTIPMSEKQHNDFISYALGDPTWIKYSWFEHDDWLESEEIVRLYNRDALFADWFDVNITDYNQGYVPFKLA